MVAKAKVASVMRVSMGHPLGWNQMQARRQRSTRQIKAVSQTACALSRSVARDAAIGRMTSKIALVTRAPEAELAVP
jgi:hypothetical protein